MFSSLLISTWSLAQPTPQPLKLVTSVYPVKMIVSAISEGISEPTVLVPPGSTPHEYSLKPSNIRDMSQADALFWVGPSLETFLAKTLKKFSGNPKPEVVALIDAPGVKLISLEHHHDHRHSDEHDSNLSSEQQDPHIWLNPHNALAMARQIEQILSELDPSNREHYQQNLTKFTQRITQLDQQLKADLAPLKDKGYFVFHDAYGYFEKLYGLNRLGEFSVNESKPGVKKMLQIQSILQQGDAVCIFSEPQFNPSLIESVTRGTDVRRAALDPLGESYQYSSHLSENYFEFMQQFSWNFIQCISGKSSDS
ncbi:MAG: zinc ABC transporter substrate-binding protein ZnuA [Pseudomonadales bacterium]|nr:zinc ABC transporter substrate-binding protein ZnuA [Pseudomonadales bacterium]